MPRLKPKPKFGRNDMVICWNTIGVPEDVHPDGVIKRGTRLRGNHPWVRMYPDVFIPENTPDDEWPSPLMGIALSPPPHESGITIAERLPAGQLVRCIHNIATLGGALLYEKGRLYKRVDAARELERFPECFEEVREDA